MTKMEGVNILFIAPSFFGYTESIQKKLIQFGANIYFLQDRPFNSPFLKAITTKCPYIIQPFINYLYIRKLERFPPSLKIDFIFVINGQTLSRLVIKFLKKRYPTSKYILYLWDSIENRKTIIKNLQYFNSVFTFDELDSKQYSIKFRPLFYIDELDSEKISTESYNLSFVGTCHSDRYFIIDKIKRNLPANMKVYFYLYLQAKWVYFVYKIFDNSFKNASIGLFKYKPIAKEEFLEVYSKSSCILDIEHPNQRGLTMRTIETIGAKKKLITTNINIKKYDIYCENILIVDRNNPIIPSSFLTAEFKNYSDEIYQKYSLTGWITEVFSN